MEQYIYISIIFFTVIICFLYIYIIYEKILGDYKKRKIQKYSEKLVPYINSIINAVIQGKSVDIDTLNDIKAICKNEYKREIIEERLLDYFENFKGDFSVEFIRFTQYVGIIQHEIENLQSKNNFKKALAAKRLGEFRSRESIDRLLHEINIENSDVKYNILLALAKIGEENSFIKAFENSDLAVSLSERSLIEIVDSFEGDKNKIYKYMINSDDSAIACVFIKSAGNYKDKSLSQDISKYLFSENKELRIACVKAIGSIGDETYLDDIIRLLQDNEWEVRAVTANALRNFVDDKTLMPLAKVLSDYQWYVRYNAATTILSHPEGIKVIYSVFQGDDKFAKDIIISAIQNSSNDNIYLYEISNDPDEVALALQIKQYITEKNKEAIT